MAKAQQDLRSIFLLRRQRVWFTQEFGNDKVLTIKCIGGILSWCKEQTIIYIQIELSHVCVNLLEKI